MTRSKRTAQEPPQLHGGVDYCIAPARFLCLDLGKHLHPRRIGKTLRSFRADRAVTR